MVVFNGFHKNTIGSSNLATEIGPRFTVGRLRTEEGVLCNRRRCNVSDEECLSSKIQSVTWQFVALPTVKSLPRPVELLTVQTVNNRLIPNLRFFIMSGNEEGLFDAIASRNSAALRLIRPIIGPKDYKLVLRLENWNILGTKLLSVYITHVVIDVSEAEWN